MNNSNAARGDTMKAANLVLALTIAWTGFGCELLRQSPLLPRNQMPPPPPITYSQYHHETWTWDSVARVVVLSPRNESGFTRAAQEFQRALTSELQRLGRFEVIAAPFDDQAQFATLTHQSGRFNEATLLAIAGETGADLIVLPTITQYSPYPRPRLGIVLQAVSPQDGKVVASVDGVWDSTDGGIAEQIRAYYRQRPTPLPAYVRNHAIVADDNFAADIALDSPALFQRYVANLATRVLVGVTEPASGSIGPSGTQLGTPPGANCTDDCQPNRNGVQPLFIRNPKSR
jgi:hypothetical protein